MSTTLIMVFISLICLKIFLFDILELQPPGRTKSKQVAKKKRSVAANRIIKAYNELPVANRPNLGTSIESIVDALDVKYGISKVNDHFVSYYYDSHEFSWECACLRYTYGGKKCTFEEYTTLKEKIKSIKTALKEQQHALEIAAVQPDLDAMPLALEALRAEYYAINSTTKELTNGR